MVARSQVYAEPDTPRAPGAQCSHRRTLPHTHTATAATDDSTHSVFDPTPQYSTEWVVLFWQPPSYFSQWFPSVFVIGGMKYSCPEQYMMAETARLVLNDDTAEPIWTCLTLASIISSIEAGIPSTALPGTAFRKTPPLLFFLPNHAGPGHEAAPIEHWHQTFG